MGLTKREASLKSSQNEAELSQAGGRSGNMGKTGDKTGENGGEKEAQRAYGRVE